MGTRYLISVENEGEVVMAKFFGTSLSYLPAIFKMCRLICDKGLPWEIDLMGNNLIPKRLSRAEVVTFALAAERAGLNYE